MPDEAQTPNGTPPSDPSNAPPSSTPAGSAEFRFGAEAPEWARGKTANEVLNLATSMADTLQRVQPPKPQAAPAPQAQPVQMPYTDEWLVQPEKATQRVVGDMMTPMVQGLQSMTQQFASTARMLAESKFGDEFRRYGPEIDTLMAEVPPENRTLENYAKVVTYVRGSHFEELAKEKAPSLLQGAVGERSGVGGVGGATASGVAFDKLPHGVGEIARQKGLTESMVRDFCKATGMKESDWMEMALNDKMVTSTAPFTFEVNANSLGVKRGFDA